MRRLPIPIQTFSVLLQFLLTKQKLQKPPLLSTARL